EHESDLADLVEVCLGYLDDPEATLSLSDDEAVVDKREHGFANRCRADAKALPQHGSRIELPGDELTRNQCCLQGALHLVAQAPTIHDRDVPHPEVPKLMSKAPGPPRERSPAGPGRHRLSASGP